MKIKSFLSLLALFLLVNACRTSSTTVASTRSLNDMSHQKQYVVQPGPDKSKSIWTTSVYSYAPGGDHPGGGANDYQLRVGGWGDLYYSLLQFDLTGLPKRAGSAVVYLYCFKLDGGGTPLHLDRIAEPWDWRTSGTGTDHDRLWWTDKPTTSLWRANQLETPIQGEWYPVDITDLYNAWQNGTYPNNGLQFRPVRNNNNNFDSFYSGNYADDPALRPKLVVSDMPWPTSVAGAVPLSRAANTDTNIVIVAGFQNNTIVFRNQTLDIVRVSRNGVPWLIWVRERNGSVRRSQSDADPGQTLMIADCSSNTHEKVSLEFTGIRQIHQGCLFGETNLWQQSVIADLGIDQPSQIFTLRSSDIK